MIDKHREKKAMREQEEGKKNNSRKRLMQTGHNIIIKHD